MDELLPKIILDATQVILSMAGVIVVVSTVSPYFLCPVAVMGILFIYVTKVFLKTAKNIKRLEGMGKYSRIEQKLFRFYYFTNIFGFLLSFNITM